MSVNIQGVTSVLLYLCTLTLSQALCQIQTWLDPQIKLKSVVAHSFLLWSLSLHLCSCLSFHSMPLPLTYCTALTQDLHLLSFLLLLSGLSPPPPPVLALWQPRLSLRAEGDETAAIDDYMNSWDGDNGQRLQWLKPPALVWMKWGIQQRVSVDERAVSSFCQLSIFAEYVRVEDYHKKRNPINAAAVEQQQETEKKRKFKHVALFKGAEAMKTAEGQRTFIHYS